MKGLKLLIRKLFFFLFDFFPIKRNRIVFFSYYGSYYGCNPKYLTEYLNKIYGNKLELVWALTDINKNLPSEIKKVKYGSIKFLFYFRTAKVICTNFNLTTDLKIRPDQFYILLWHNAMRLKRTHQDVNEGLSNSFIHMAKEDSKKINFLCCGSEFMKDRMQKSFWYDGPVFNTGLPRNDLLIHSDKTKIAEIKKKLGISEDSIVVIYAPTFRKNHEINKHLPDFKTLIKTLRHKTNKEVSLLVRLHPHLLNNSYTIKNIIIDYLDVTSYDDVAELLLISDLLITDYSSVMFDFMLTKRPVFLFTPDKNEYAESDFGFYFNFEDLPVKFAETGPELIDNIINFDNEAYQKKLSVFFKQIGMNLGGKASENIGKRIIKYINE